MLGCQSIPTYTHIYIHTHIHTHTALENAGISKEVFEGQKVFAAAMKNATGGL